RQDFEVPTNSAWIFERGAAQTLGVGIHELLHQLKIGAHSFRPPPLLVPLNRGEREQSLLTVMLSSSLQHVIVDEGDAGLDTQRGQADWGVDCEADPHHRDVERMRLRKD